MKRVLILVVSLVLAISVYLAISSNQGADLHESEIASGTTNYVTAEERAGETYSMVHLQAWIEEGEYPHKVTKEPLTEYHNDVNISTGAGSLFTLEGDSSDLLFVIDFGIYSRTDEPLSIDLDDVVAITSNGNEYYPKTPKTFRPDDEIPADGSSGGELHFELSEDTLEDVDKVTLMFPEVYSDESGLEVARYSYIPLKMTVPESD